MEDKKLFLLDAYALIYRAYYALIRAPRVTSKGFNTSAIFGFVNTLEEVLKKEAPSHIAVCFDPHGATFRHEAYPEYKAQREQQPEDITLALPYIKKIIAAYGISTIEIEGFEADDVIGTLSKKAENEGFLTYMMTPDKDYGQLVTDRILMYKPSVRGGETEIRGPKEVCEKYGLESPLQVIDLLALEGDAVDNIPGCPGVGEKTAVKLIKEWGTVENLLANSDSIKGALKTKLKDFAEQIKFSKFLATIRTDVPVDIDIDKLKMGEKNYNKLLDLFTELEFRTFINRMNLTELAVVNPPAPDDGTGMGSLFDVIDNSESDTPAIVTIADFKSEYLVISEKSDIQNLVDRCLGLKEVGMASYAVGAEDMNSKWFGISISPEEGKAFYIPLPAFPDERKATIELFRPLLENYDGTIVSHDIKREILLFRREGVEFNSKYYDTSVAHYLLEPEMNHAIQRVAAAYLKYHTLDYSDDRLPKKGDPIASGEEPKRVGEVADLSLRLYFTLSKIIEEQKLQKLLDDVEFPLIKVLADMEWTGVRIDVNALSELSRRFSARLNEMEQQAYKFAGGYFNIGAPNQVGEVLFERLKLDSKAKRTKRGAYSTTEEVLEKYRDAHPIVNLILEIRALRKLLTTYVDALPALINPLTGKIHTTFNQIVTSTGRLSSTAPNLQNIPIRSEDGREVRRAFIPDKGDLILSADYSQIELRLIADISHDRDMIMAFLEDSDIHRATAAKIFHEKPEDVTFEQRLRAKTANFGIIYGISAFGLSQRLSIPRSEAKELIDGYFRSYPGIKDYIEDSIRRAHATGYVTTIMGRKRMLPEINSRNSVVRGYAERNAVNAPIQGSAADIIKVAMVDIAREFKSRQLKSKMILQVHDELVFNVIPEELSTVQEIVTDKMVNAYHGLVPLEVSSGTGKNWLEAH